MKRAELPFDPAAVEIFEKVQQTYDALETYRSVCEVVADYNIALIFDANNFHDLKQEEVGRLEHNEEFKKVFNKRYLTETTLVMKLSRDELYSIQCFLNSGKTSVWGSPISE